MPIYMELLVMLLVTYCIGLGIGWALFARTPADESDKGDTAE